MNYFLRVRTAASWMVSLLILAAGGGAFAYLIHKPKSESNLISHQAKPLVQTTPVVEHQGRLDLQVDGMVVPFREVALAAEVSGRITLKSDVCRPGKIVAKGTPLLEIDARDYELRVRRFQTQLKQAQSSLNELYVESKNTELLVRLAEEDVELNRAELLRLQKIDAGAIAESDLDKVKRAELASRNALQTLRNQLQLFRARQARLQSTEQLAQTELEQAKLDLDRTRVVSPIDGVIVRESVEQDSFVEKGVPLVTIEDTAAVEVRCNLKMEQVTWLWRQESASATSQSGYQVPSTPVTVKYGIEGREFVWQGMLSRYEGIGLDERTRMVPCRVLVNDPRGTAVETGENTDIPQPQPPPLVRGMYVSLTIHVSPNVPLARVPEQAVRPGKTIWVLRDGRIKILRNIRLVELIDVPDASAGSSRQWLVEWSGTELKSGDAIVVSPLNFVTDGLEVRVTEP